MTKKYQSKLKPKGMMESQERDKKGYTSYREKIPRINSKETKMLRDETILFNTSRFGREHLQIVSERDNEKKSEYAFTFNHRPYTRKTLPN